MKRTEIHAQIISQELIINSLRIEIKEFENKVRFQNTLIANLKAELDVKNNEIKRFLNGSAEL